MGETVASAPIATQLNQCFLPTTQVLLATGHVVSAAALRRGDHVQSICHVGDKVVVKGTPVKASRLLPARDRDFVVPMLSYPLTSSGNASAQLVLTADHP